MYDPKKNRDESLMKDTVNILGDALSHKFCNIRYLSLEAMSNLVATSANVAKAVKKHQKIVIQSLKDKDVSIRKRALDLLYGMCNKSTSKLIVRELLDYLVTAEYDLREELATKIAILAEKFASNKSWYVDVMLKLIRLAGEDVPDDIWYRVIQIIMSGDENLQTYAAQTVFQQLFNPQWNEITVRVAAYILGEFGSLIEEESGSSALEQFDQLHSKFSHCDNVTKAILLTTYGKFTILYTDNRELQMIIQRVFDTCENSVDVELQQRAVEYKNLTKQKMELSETVWDPMPAWDEDAEEVHHHHEEGEEEDMEAPPLPKERDNEADSLEDQGDNSEEEKFPEYREDTLVNVKETPKKQSNSQWATNLMDILGSQPVPSTVPNPNRVPSGPMQNPASLVNVMTAPNPNAIGSGGSMIATTGSGGSMMQNPTIAATPSSPPTSSGSLSTQANLSNPEYFKLLGMSDQGYLYKDQYVQVGLKSKYEPGVGFLKIFYGNVSANPIKSFTTKISNHNAITFVIQDSPSPDLAPAGGQSSELVNMKCLTEYDTPPILNLSFISNNTPVVLSINLPVLPHKFLQPLQLDLQSFGANWGKLGDNETQTIYKATKESITIPFIKDVLTKCGFAVLDGVDVNVNNLVAAATFVSVSKQVPCLIRMETNAQAVMVRATWRVSSNVIGKAVREYLLSLLEDKSN